MDFAQRTLLAPDQIFVQVLPLRHIILGHHGLVYCLTYLHKSVAVSCQRPAAEPIYIL